MSITTMRHLVDLLLRAEWSANKKKINAAHRYVNPLDIIYLNIYTLRKSKC